MPYNEKLASRIRIALAHLSNVEEKKMFGKLAFLVKGHMCLTAGPDRMMCRIDPLLHAQAISKPGVRTVVMRGKSYKGYVYVDEATIKTKAALEKWIAMALDFNGRYHEVHSSESRNQPRKR